MTPWIGAVFLFLALRGLVKRAALFRPPTTDRERAPGGSSSGEPQAEDAEPLPEDAQPLGATDSEPALPRPLEALPNPPGLAPALGWAGWGIAILLIADLSWVAAWVLVGVALGSQFLGRRSSPQISNEFPAEDAAKELKLERIAAVRAAGRLDVVWFYALPLLLPSLILLVRARTWQGHAFSLACVLLPLPLLLGFAQRPRAAKVSAATVLALLLGLWTAVPRSDPGVIESRLLSGPAPSTWTPAALVPEEDQFMLATFFLPLLDAYVDWDQSVRVREAFGSVYDRAGSDPDLAGLPSVMSATYRDMAGAELPHHVYLYVPEGHAPVSGRPVLLFCHGSLGSFQGYLAALRPLAEREGFAIVAPSYGSGIWRRKAGLERIEEALALCSSDPRLDAQRVVAVGISAGGTALSRAGAAFPERFLGLAFLSPMLEPAFVKEPWQGRPVLVVHGSADRRIPERFVSGCVRELETAGVKTTYLLVEGQDHFLYFSDPEQVNAALQRWLKEVVPR